jgi:hypothetical protein
MAPIKPKTVRGDYIWTGYKWVRRAERSYDKVVQERMLDREQRRYYNTSEYGNKRKQPLASWPGRRAPAMRQPVSASSPPKPAKTSTYDYSRRPPRAVSGSPKTMSVTSGTSTSTGRGSGGSTGRGSGGSTGRARDSKRKPPVLQQNTMWVTAKESKTGKGYLAQKGKPEKRVTARVKIQTDTVSGKKAGSTYAYKAGKTVRKVGKK